MCGGDHNAADRSAVTYMCIGVEDDIGNAGAFSSIEYLSDTSVIECSEYFVVPEYRNRREILMASRKFVYRRRGRFIYHFIFHESTPLYEGLIILSRRSKYRKFSAHFHTLVFETVEAGNVCAMVEMVFSSPFAENRILHSFGFSSFKSEVSWC